MSARAKALLAQAVAFRALADALEAEAAALDEQPASAPTALYLTIAAYAARVTMSKRTIRNFLDAGLPSVGRGRGRRIAVAEADAWLRDHKDHVDDSVEQQARAAARAAAGRAAR